MTKQLGEVSLVVSGNGDGATGARFEYVVTSTDDPSLIKHSSLVVDTPVFDVSDLATFFDGYVDAIKENEGII